MTNRCNSCGHEFTGEGSICPSCALSLNETTTSFAPVGVVKEDPARTEVQEGVTPVLRVSKGPGMGEAFYLDSEETTLGRDPQSDIFLNDMTVSREHARIERIGSTVIVRDAESLNGTYVNGISVDEAELNPGDIVQIGTFQLTFNLS